MKVIVGIGNKGTKYNLTRHNVGFIILDLLANKFQIEFNKTRHEYNFTGSRLNASLFVLIKPITFVNLTGIAVKKALYDFSSNLESLLVISDDINLPLGHLRLRKMGGDGGHNGLASIIETLGTEKFARLRFGIGNNFEYGKMSNFVLSKFKDEELASLKLNFDYAISVIENFIEFGLNKTFEYYSKSINKINS